MGQTCHKISSLTFHHQVEIGEAAPGVAVLMVQQKIANSSANQGQPSSLSSSHKGLNQDGRYTWNWNEHPLLRRWALNAHPRT